AVLGTGSYIHAALYELRSPEQCRVGGRRERRWRSCPATVGGSDNARHRARPRTSVAPSEITLRYETHGCPCSRAHRRRRGRGRPTSRRCLRLPTSSERPSECSPSLESCTESLA